MHVFSLLIEQHFDDAKIGALSKVEARDDEQRIVFGLWWNLDLDLPE